MRGSGLQLDLERILYLYGRKYSDLLAIDLHGRKPSGLFRWFIASILLGPRISETLAIRAYWQLKTDGLLSFTSISRATWDDLVASLDAGGYVRYDFSTASDLQAVVKMLGKKYGGDLNRLHDSAKDSRNLEERLQEFRGVGPVTANIFLRDLRGIWRKADPSPGHLAKKATDELGIEDAKRFWQENQVTGFYFSNLETALMRIGREARRRKTTSAAILREKGLLI